MKEQEYQHIFTKINNFIHKYYVNKLLQGGIYFISILFMFFIGFSILEHFGQLNVKGRTFLFWSYIFISILILIKFILFPLFKLLKLRKNITHKDAAKIIGTYFKEIDDKLLNIIELGEMGEAENELISASISQKIKQIRPFHFNTVIDLSQNRKYVKWIILPASIIVLLFITDNEYVITESSARIIKHNAFFEPQSPFNFNLNNSLEVVQYNDWELNITISGKEIPSVVYIKFNENSFKLKNNGENNFTHLIKNVSENITFYLLAGGYESEAYLLKSLKMPKIIDFSLALDYPKYTKIKDEEIKNNGDITIPEGTKIKWEIDLKDSDEIYLILNRDTIKKNITDNFSHRQGFVNNCNYSIITKNKNTLSDTVAYYITVLKDQYPEIYVTQNYDSLSEAYLFSGIIKDDYETTNLTFNYEQALEDSMSMMKYNIPIQGLNEELFFYEFNFNTLNLDPNTELKYWFAVLDNDGVNGAKKTVSKYFYYKEPSKEEIIKEKDALNKDIQDGFNDAIKLTEDIKKDIADLNKMFLEKKVLTWQEKQKAKNIIKKQQELKLKIESTLRKNNQNSRNQEKINSSLKEKQKQLDDLLNNLLNEEMEKILQEIMNEEKKEKLKELLDKLKDENSDLEKELDRDLEILKQLEFEQKTEELINKIKELQEKQEDLIKESETKESNATDLAEQQNSLSEEMSKIKEDLKTLRKKNNVLEDKHTIPETEDIENNITNNMQESIRELNEKKKKNSRNSQKEAVKNLESLSNKLNDMIEKNNSTAQMENIETLRQILENLISLSFDQENIMSEINKTPKNSSEFIKIIQNQKKLSDNSQIIEDSLFALSKRVVQIKTIINTEISAIKNRMSKTTKVLEERNVNKGLENQQFIMTSINNLALLLSETLEQMQKDMEESNSNCNKPKNCNKPQNCNKPSISDLKKNQDKLNANLKKNKKKRNAKELMELAKQQEEIRRRLMELRNELMETGNKSLLDKILQEMEETETDIINNNITRETINRQKELLKNLLKVEDSSREDENENTRESNEAMDQNNKPNDVYLEYLTKKKAQEELLKTTPVKLKPYYKKKVNEFFNILIKKDQ